MKTGDKITWNNNLNAGHSCVGLYLRKINQEFSEVICTSVGNKLLKIKLQVQTNLLKLA